MTTITDTGLSRIAAAMIRQAVRDTCTCYRDSDGKPRRNSPVLRCQARLWLRTEGVEMLEIMFPGVEVPRRIREAGAGDQLELGEATD